MSQELLDRWNKWFYSKASTNACGHRQWTGTPVRHALRFRKMYLLIIGTGEKLL